MGGKKKGGKKKGGKKKGGGGGRNNGSGGSKQGNSSALKPRPSLYEEMVVAADRVKQGPHSGPPDSLTKKVNNSQQRFAFRIVDNGDACGRRAVASRDIAAGEVLLRESTPVWIIRGDHVQEACATCTKALPRGKPQFSCVECKRACYCSAECQAADQALHTLECPGLQVLEEVSMQTQVPLDLVRVALRYVVQRPLQRVAEEKKIKVKGLTADSFACGFTDLVGMVSHVEHMEPADLQRSTACAERLLELLPDEERCTVREVVEFMGRVNSNAHSLTQNDDAMGEVGLGLFPLCAIFNHSCYVNCVFVSEGNKLVFRAVRPVPKGEELCVNYIGLYQSRRARQTELLLSKQFQCNCRRCTLRPSCEEEKERFLNDQYVSGVWCPACRASSGAKSTGLLRLTRCAKGVAAADADAAAADADAADASDSASPELEMVCNECGAVCDDATLASIEAKADQIEERALMAYQNPEMKPITRRSELELAIDQLCALFHPRHHRLFNLHLPLINVCGALADHRMRLEHCRHVVELAEAAWPEWFLPKVNYYQALSAAMARIAQEKRREGAALPKKLQQKYTAERLACLRKVAETYRICRGAEDVLTVKALAAVKQVEDQVAAAQKRK